MTFADSNGGRRPIILVSDALGTGKGEAAMPIINLRALGGTGDREIDFANLRLAKEANGLVRTWRRDSDDPRFSEKVAAFLQSARQQSDYERMRLTKIEAEWRKHRFQRSNETLDRLADLLFEERLGLGHLHGPEVFAVLGHWFSERHCLAKDLYNRKQSQDTNNRF